MNCFACAALALCLIAVAPAGTQDRAQDRPQDRPPDRTHYTAQDSAPANPHQAIDDLKGKIFDAKMAQKTFERGMKYCGELDGKHFYFLARDRVLDLEDFHRSLESLAKQGVFNPEKHRPWTEQDAAERWDQAQKQAASDKANCALAASLPELEKQLDELEGKQPAPAKKN